MSHVVAVRAGVRLAVRPDSAPMPIAAVSLKGSRVHGAVDVVQRPRALEAVVVEFALVDGPVAEPGRRSTGE